MEELKNTEEKTYTQEELDKIVQSTSDRRVSEALATQARKMKEAQQLSLMNEQEKWEFEMKKREDALAEREKALALAEMKNEVIQVLNERGLNIAFADLVVDADATVTQSKINQLEKAFKESVQGEIQKRMASNVPSKPESSVGITKEDFAKMTLAQMADLQKNQPELYNQLRKG